MQTEMTMRELSSEEVASVEGGVAFLLILAAPAVVEFAAGVIIGGAAVGAGIYLAEKD